MDLYDTFEIIKKRPQMYIEYVSIQNLYVFLGGYWFSKMNFKIIYTEQEKEFSGFQKWIEEKYKTTTCRSWASIILLNSEDDEAAFWKFFDLLDEYLEFTRSNN